MSVVHKLAIWVKRHNLIPEGLRWFIQKHSNMLLDIRTASWIAKDPYANDPPVSSDKSKYPYVLGIIKEFWHIHWPYVAACRELGVSYKVLDITGSDWIEVIRDSRCDAFLVWPSAIMTIWKQMYDERLKVIAYDLGKIIFPTYDELWFWESKRRMRDWLVAHDVPHPCTWIFYNFDEARRFLDTAQFPIVFKLDFGDCSQGVRILRSKKDALHTLKRAFIKGIRLPNAHPLDIQWGNVVFQQNIENHIEWRLIRVDDSYFGYHKKQIGDFASGFGQAIFGDIPRPLLELIQELTEKHRFFSMSMDVLVDNDGKYYVTEMQSLFGDTVSHRKLVIDGKPGRYIYNKQNKTWIFEEGIFDQNICCNLRVEHVIKLLEQKNAGN